MKRFTNIFKLAFISILATTLFAACELETTDTDATGDNSGTVQVDGTTSVLTQGLITYYGLYEGIQMHNFDIYIATSGINPQTETGTGNVVYLELVTPSSTFSGGTFTFNSSSNLTGNALTSGRFMRGLNVATEEMEALYMAEGGSVSVLKTADGYDVTFNLTVREYSTMWSTPIGDPISMTGSYSGSLVYDDATSKVTIAKKF